MKIIPKDLHNKKSLIGGVNGFDNAESLLASSIGDIRSKHKYLLNIDHKIKFLLLDRDENFNNQYPQHFHIVKDNYNQYIVDNDNVKFFNKTKKDFPRAFETH